MGSTGLSNSDNNERPEYTINFNEHGFDIVHRHYADRQEYDVYYNGEYIDTAESTQELLKTIEDYRRQNR